MKRRGQGPGVALVAFLVGAFGVRCGDSHGDVVPVDLRTTLPASVSSGSPLPPIDPACIPSQRPADGIGPCGCPGDSPRYSDADLAEHWYVDEQREVFVAKTTGDPLTEYFAPLWRAGACPCMRDLLVRDLAEGSRARNHFNGYLRNGVADSDAMECHYVVYKDDRVEPKTGQGCE